MIGIIAGLTVVVIGFLLVRFIAFPLMWKGMKFGNTKEERAYMKRMQTRWDEYLISKRKRETT